MTDEQIADLIVQSLNAVLPTKPNGAPALHEFPPASLLNTLTEGFYPRD